MAGSKDNLGFVNIQSKFCTAIHADGELAQAFDNIPNLQEDKDQAIISLKVSLLNWDTMQDKDTAKNTMSIASAMILFSRSSLHSTRPNSIHLSKCLVIFTPYGLGRIKMLSKTCLIISSNLLFQISLLILVVHFRVPVLGWSRPSKPVPGWV